MKKYILKTAVLAFVLASSFNSCTKKLDLQPTNDVTADIAYSTPLGYKQNLGKVYGAFALTGNYGPGSGDIAGIDAGTSDFFRLFWKAQELSTDEAVVAWGDPGIQDFHLMNWGPTNPMLQGLYYRSLYQISVANEFLRQSTDAKVAERGITGQDAANIKQYALEARFIRAYQYWVLMDLFGNPPFITETDVVGVTIPKQINRADLFNYIENELKAIETPMVAAKSNEYGRADKAACQALLARLYLNAKVYTGTAKNNEAITYAKKVIDAGYTPISNYTQLMMADNHTNTSENILTINYDGLKTQNWGGTTFLTHASIGGSMNAADYGVDGGWYGIRTTKAIVDLYGDLGTNQDKRAMFYTNGQNKEINDLTSFNDGFAVTKYRNKTKAGANGSSLTWVDIDMPIFRIAEMYLIYAEGVARGGTTGDIATATSYINLLRTRAYGNASGNITPVQLTVDFILQERAKELMWEGFRRTDLIRYDRFVESAYLWPWKGGAKDGTGVAAFRKIYPIPSSDLASNTNLKQNTGY
ncbi:MAG: RagB/SusD family nutrient uptake outer membrane protein [Chitinophagaceae bacterium]|nr:RagB/SusD family nutrient uptake outer membrane protein [Chitinophagaceae bacterium]